ncbi:1-acyl-sn-glycerol-3-phosphate acyltransferase epsilon [Galemys pyrenaicus]|uniref:1-acyl-sn-glycerol-3-phosphate acyltransferase epsilon n=1 Tax=Galemys pyrenaicus TaxID=202257 RepID=A0A8J6A5C9_GALPY|nr:1-acyl-sn-glycerol-3-phosphate acyltransferase epsilon [Galemys pyrenaicus]
MVSVQGHSSLGSKRQTRWSTRVLEGAASLLGRHPAHLPRLAAGRVTLSRTGSSGLAWALRRVSLQREGARSWEEAQVFQDSAFARRPSLTTVTAPGPSTVPRQATALRPLHSRCPREEPGRGGSIAWIEPPAPQLRHKNVTRQSWGPLGPWSKEVAFLRRGPRPRRGYGNGRPTGERVAAAAPRPRPGRWVTAEGQGAAALPSGRPGGASLPRPLPGGREQSPAPHSPARDPRRRRGPRAGGGGRASAGLASRCGPARAARDWPRRATEAAGGGAEPAAGPRGRGAAAARRPAGKMLLSLVLHLYSMRCVLPAAVLLGSAPTYVLAWGAWRLLSALLPARYYQAVDDRLYCVYQSMVLFFFEHYTGVQVSAAGGAAREADESGPGPAPPGPGARAARPPRGGPDAHSGSRRSSEVPL